MMDDAIKIQLRFTRTVTDGPHWPTNPGLTPAQSRVGKSPTHRPPLDQTNVFLYFCIMYFLYLSSPIHRLPLDSVFALSEKYFNPLLNRLVQTQIIRDMSVAIICPINSRHFPTIVITQEGERAENNEVGTLKPYLVYWAWHVFTATWAANKWTSRLWRLSANNIYLCFLKYQSKFTTK